MLVQLITILSPIAPSTVGPKILGEVPKYYISSKQNDMHI
jgi:hypothetical protein